VNRLEASPTYNVSELGNLIQLESSTLLSFDPSNDLFAEVFGNLDAAKNVAVVVPGSGQSLGNYFGKKGLRNDALALQSEANTDGNTATIAWMGYRTPNLRGWPLDLSATDYRRSEPAGRALAGFVAGIQAGHSFRTTVIGHSYGSLVAAHAAAYGMQVDNLVVIGSPGLGLVDQRQIDAFYSNANQLWAARTPDDPFATRNGWGIIAGNFYGLNPYQRTNGFAQFNTNGGDLAGISGHDSYFSGESLVNLGDIVTGHYDSVSRVRP
jgi:pimeloyl-ACP methyl ester carboxylesterase